MYVHTYMKYELHVSTSYFVVAIFYFKLAENTIGNYCECKLKLLSKLSILKSEMSISHVREMSACRTLQVDKGDDGQTDEDGEPRESEKGRPRLITRRTSDQ